MFRRVRRANNTKQSETNHELEQFVSEASHDLREPLHTTGLCSDVLQQKYAFILDSEGMDLLQYVSASVAETQLLVDDFLQISSVPAKTAAAIRPVSMSCRLRTSFDKPAGHTDRGGRRDRDR